MNMLIAPKISSMNYTKQTIYHYAQKPQQKEWYCKYGLTKTPTAFYVYIFHGVEPFLFLFFTYIFCNKSLFICSDRYNTKSNITNFRYGIKMYMI